MPFERRKSFGDRRGGSSGGFGGRSGGSGGFGGERRWGGSGGSGGFGARRSFSESDEPKPVKEGEEHEVTIAEMSRKGDGIARVQNFVVFVAGTQAGDKVRIRIKEVRGRHAVGEVVSESSPTHLDKHEKEEEIVSEEGSEEESEEKAEEKAEGEEEESEKSEVPSDEEEGAA